jgi:hypothetical protein
MWRTLWAASVAVFLGGCATGPLVENPLFVGHKATSQNPVYIPHGGAAYAQVFGKVIDVLDDYFDIAYENPYDGWIISHPRVAPGIEQPWKAGSPDFYQRVLAFFQTIRHRGVVKITPANDGGYFIDVKIFKELEDIPNPIRSTAGMANFRLVSTVERQYEVIEPSIFEAGWIPIGRDEHLEQEILERLAKFDLSCPPPRSP